ncbi:M14 family metallopeptidase [Neobacillus novalis]|uniref:M14 family metallopeptidase n=1 Tax=Neobacillus novalis TaxID=220687 RepID=A0AA95MV10_9BACI|nr:M14 family metallopeptidase [Neobacillus novalis]WHY86898.1 M14 family metallopeptidase [Neobacillus novalis]
MTKKKKLKWKRSLMVMTAITGLGFSTFYPGLSIPTAAVEQPDQPLPAEESVSIVQLEVPNDQAKDKLLELGIDLTHNIEQHDGVYEVDAVVTPSEIAMLKTFGINVKDTLITENEWNTRVAERQSAVQLQASLAASEDTLKVLRANHFTNQSATFLYLEVKSSAGATASTALKATWTEDGVEKSATLSRFVDYGEYIYHYLMVPVTAIPTSVKIDSNLGGNATSFVTEWLVKEPKHPKTDYVTDFVDHYMAPNELYERAEKLAKEFPKLVEIIDMPNKTNGYRRLAQATIGSTTNASVVVSSKAWGHEGGNDVSVEFENPVTNNSPLKGTVDGKKIIVDLATNSAGTVTSTAAQVVSALNSNAGQHITATTYRGNAGTGVVAAATVKLTDNLKAPADVSRDPFTVKAIRIGKHRDGSKPGVLGYAQEHAREWVTPLVTIETAERLLRNYSNDSETRKLVDNLDIFLVPSVNPDGANYSFNDYNIQRKNMTNHCGPTASDPGNRNAWGVDLNRNHSVGSVFDGYIGGGTSCTGETYAGPFENSEPEARNLVWLADNNPNIKFAMNIHSYGGYFMWSPGAYDAKRVTLPRPTAGQEAFYWAASDLMLNDIQDHRGTVILPSRTGPIPDVLYSAAGNSADYLWYEKGIYAWNFEVGADLWNKDTKRWQAVGFQPAFAEGHEEAMEFSNGLIGLIKVAYNSSKDHQPPSSKASPGNGKYTGPVEVKIETSEPATVFYTLDGSRPTFQSKKIQLSGTREFEETLKIDKTTTINYFAVDAAGNIEKNYNPLGNGKNYNSVTITIK